MTDCSCSEPHIPLFMCRGIKVRRSALKCDSDWQRTLSFEVVLTVFRTEQSNSLLTPNLISWLTVKRLGKTKT